MIDLDKFDGHTPGPWVCDDRSGCVAVYPESRVGDGPGLSRHNDRNIHYSDKGAFYNGTHWQMDETAVIDARLIAAAPQLLAELKALRAWREAVNDALWLVHGSLPKSLIDSWRTSDKELNDE